MITCTGKRKTYTKTIFTLSYYHFNVPYMTTKHQKNLIKQQDRKMIITKQILQFPILSAIAQCDIFTCMLVLKKMA